MSAKAPNPRPRRPGDPPKPKPTPAPPPPPRYHDGDLKKRVENLERTVRDLNDRYGALARLSGQARYPNV
jgi:hypothetical protein